MVDLLLILMMCVSTATSCSYQYTVTVLQTGEKSAVYSEDLCKQVMQPATGSFVIKCVPFNGYRGSGFDMALTAQDIPQATELVQQWLEQVVIGLNLCPFAHKPWRDGQVRILVSLVDTEEEALALMVEELKGLDDSQPEVLETTILAFPNLWPEFLDYNDFLDLADACLVSIDRVDQYQIASFHPHYQFGGTQPEDAENLTNRAPFPLLHLLREASVAAAIERHPDADGIPDRNIRRVCELSEKERRALFPWLS